MGSGKRKPDIRDISRQAPEDQEIHELMRAFSKADAHPIVTAILGHALLEHELESMLRPKFRSSDNATWARLTGDNGPLATFNQKVIAAHGFGLIDDAMRKNLNIVGAIRNAFAHSKKLITFNEATVTQKLRTIRLPEKHRGKLGKSLKRLLKEDMPSQARFVILCLELSTHLFISDTKRERARNRAKQKRLDAQRPFSNFFAQMSPVQRAFVRGAQGLSQSAGPITLRSLPTPAEVQIRQVEGPDD